MTTNRVHGNNYGIQAGTVNGTINFHGGRMEINGTTSDDDDDVVNEVYGNNYGIQSGSVSGDINFS